MIPFLQTSQCSFSLVSSLHLASPMYRAGHSCRMQYNYLPRGNLFLTFVDTWVESPPRLKDYSDDELPANMPDVLTHPSHIGYYHQCFLLLFLSLITAACVCCILCGWGRSITEKVCRIAVLLEDELSEASLKSGYSDAGKKTVANIKSTVSDRTQVQKSFNEMLVA